jgi:hypothetical protein
MAIKLIAGQRDEKLATFYGARIGRNAVRHKRWRHVEQPAVGPFSDCI